MISERHTTLSWYRKGPFNVDACDVNGSELVVGSDELLIVVDVVELGSVICKR